MAKSRWKNGIPNSVRQKIKDKERMAKIRAKIEKGSKPKVRVKTPAIPTIENPKGKFTKIRNIPEERTAEDILAALNKAGKSGNLGSIGMINILDDDDQYYSLDSVVYTDNGKKLIATKWEGEWGVTSMDEFLGKPEKGLVPTDKPVPIKVKKPTRAAINAFKGLLIAGGLSGFAPTTREQYNARRREKYAQGNQTPVVDDRTVLLYNGEGEIAHIYKPKSRVMPAGKGYIAVKLKTGEKGWIKQGERMFVDEDYARFMLGCVEKAALCRGRYTSMFDSLTLKQKAEFVAQAHNIDWTAFWKIHYNPRTGLLDSEGVEIIEEIFNNIKS